MNFYVDDNFKVLILKSSNIDVDKKIFFNFVKTKKFNRFELYSNFLLLLKMIAKKL